MRSMIVVVLWLGTGVAHAATPAGLLAALEAEATRASGAAVRASATRGEAFFNARHADWSCASCHTPDPRRDGRHAVTGKLILPMAPAANSARLTDRSKTDKWFRRNCQDVLGRSCSALEQADVVAYLLSLGS